MHLQILSLIPASSFPFLACWPADHLHDSICRDIDLKTSFDIQRKSDELHFTYLDTIGRPVIVARKTNLVEQHIADFEVGTQSLIKIVIWFDIISDGKWPDW